MTRASYIVHDVFYDYTSNFRVLKNVSTYVPFFGTLVLLRFLRSESVHEMIV